MTVQNMLNIQILSRLAADREAQLRRAASVQRADRSSGHMRRWLGFQLVRLGAWLASDPALRPIRVRSATP